MEKSKREQSRLLKSTDNGNTWTAFGMIDRPPYRLDYFSASACPYVTSGGAIISITTDLAFINQSQYTDALFVKYKVSQGVAVCF